MAILRKKTLDGILKTFHAVRTDLTDFVDAKAQQIKESAALIKDEEARKQLLQGEMDKAKEVLSNISAMLGDKK